MSILANRRKSLLLMFGVFALGAIFLSGIRPRNEASGTAANSSPTAAVISTKIEVVKAVPRARDLSSVPDTVTVTGRPAGRPASPQGHTGGSPNGRHPTAADISKMLNEQRAAFEAEQQELLEGSR